MIPTVWRFAFRSAFAASVTVEAVLAKTRDQVSAVILCENLDSKFRSAVYEADLLRRVQSDSVTFRWRWLTGPQAAEDFDWDDLGTITIPQARVIQQLSAPTGDPATLRTHVLTCQDEPQSSTARKRSVMFSLKKCFPTVDSGLLLHPSVFEGIIKVSEDVKYVAMLMQITVAGRHKLSIVGLTICGYATGIVSQCTLSAGAAVDWRRHHC